MRMHNIELIGKGSPPVRLAAKGKDLTISDHMEEAALPERGNFVEAYRLQPCSPERYSRETAGTAASSRSDTLREKTLGTLP